MTTTQRTFVSNSTRARQDLAELTALGTGTAMDTVKAVRELIVGMDKAQALSLDNLVRQKLLPRGVYVEKDRGIGSRFTSKVRTLTIISAATAEHISHLLAEGGDIAGAKDYSYLAKDRYSRAGIADPALVHTRNILDRGLALMQSGSEEQGRRTLARAVLTGYELRLQPAQLTDLVNLVVPKVGGRVALNEQIHTLVPLDSKPIVYTGPDADFAPLARP